MSTASTLQSVGDPGCWQDFARQGHGPHRQRGSAEVVLQQAISDGPLCPPMRPSTGREVSMLVDTPARAVSCSPMRTRRGVGLDVADLGYTITVHDRERTGACRHLSSCGDCDRTDPADEISAPCRGRGAAGSSLPRHEPSSRPRLPGRCAATSSGSGTEPPAAPASSCAACTPVRNIHVSADMQRARKTRNDCGLASGFTSVSRRSSSGSR